MGETRSQDVPDYARTYDEFWREIVENPDGTLNRDQVMRELHDYRTVMHEVALAYDDVTGGRLSKPNTAAQHVISAVDERIKAAREEVATESAVLSPADLAEILDYVVGRGDVRVVRHETLDRAFAALKATLPREVTP